LVTVKIKVGADEGARIHFPTKKIDAKISSSRNDRMKAAIGAKARRVRENTSLIPENENERFMNTASCHSAAAVSVHSLVLRRNYAHLNGRFKDMTKL
jgi:hypothetical protein